MNLKYKELAEQAGWMIDDDVEGFNTRLEKFAELLIRECMDLLEDFTADIHMGGIQYSVVGASETLQEHFGIEE